MKRKGGASESEGPAGVVLPLLFLGSRLRGNDVIGVGDWYGPVIPARPCEPGSAVARRWRFTGPCGTLRPEKPAGAVLVVLFLDSRLRGNDVIAAGEWYGPSDRPLEGIDRERHGSLSHCRFADLLVGQAFLPAQGGRGTENPVVEWRATPRDGARCIETTEMPCFRITRAGRRTLT